MVGIKVDGDLEIAKALMRLRDRAGTASIQAATAGAEIVRDDAERRAPIQKANKKHIADNIKVRKAAVHKDGSITAQVYVPGGKGGFGYANPLEHGHIVRTNKGYKWVAPRAFMGPARDANKDAVKQKISEVLRDAIR